MNELKVIVSARQCGKTKKLVAWMEQDRNRILITFSEQEADRLRQRYPWLKDRVFSWFAMQGSIVNREAEYGIDNLDMILSRMTRLNIGAVSLTGQATICASQKRPVEWVGAIRFMVGNVKTKLKMRRKK